MSGVNIHEWASPLEPEPMAGSPPPEEHRDRRGGGFGGGGFDPELLKSLLPLLGKDLGPLGALLNGGLGAGGKPDIATLLPLFLQNMKPKKPHNTSVGKTVRLDDYTRVN